MFLLRHGQSVFNLHYTATRKDPGIADPELTPLGHRQAETAAEQLAKWTITRIIISPYTRALQTAEPILAQHRVPVMIMQEVRERAAFICDIGTAPAQLAARFPHHDFTHLPNIWWPEEKETVEETIERANAFRTLIAACSDSGTTLLVSHWAFILALTGVSLANGELMEYDPRSPVPAEIIWRP